MPLGIAFWVWSPLAPLHDPDLPDMPATLTALATDDLARLHGFCNSPQDKSVHVSSWPFRSLNHHTHDPGNIPLHAQQIPPSIGE